MKITIPVSVGEVLDKLSILEIKEEMILDEEKRAHILAETRLLEDAIAQHYIFDEVGMQELYVSLDAVNRRLWDVEESLREMEQRQDFGQSFIDAARSVYQLNDARAGFKREMNSLMGSTIREVKSYV